MNQPGAHRHGAQLLTEDRGGTTTLVLTGHLDAVAAGRLWRVGHREARRKGAMAVDLSGLVYCDLSGASLLLSMEAAHGAALPILGAVPHVTALLARARASVTPAGPRAATRSASPNLVRAVGDAIAYLGEVVCAVLFLPARRRMLRWPDLLRFADQAGVRAIPLIILLGYLMGLILAFQSAVPMRRFGADLYVANLVAISLLRELGPLLAAVILAGRTGSAFAAEIGSMKVNQEVDALVTMSIDPVTMLVLPRLMAAILVMPALALILDVAGLLGMTTVMTGFGYPLITIARQVQAAATPLDLFGGLFKGMCFGSAVAVISCFAGLNTGVGPRAVGQAATAAVVGGIVATIFLDGLFSILFYRLGL